jgi:hypothetical protein
MDNFVKDVEKDIDDITGGSFFAKAAKNPKKLQNNLLGSASYSYADQINSPSQMGMSSNGDMNTLGNDVNGMLGYVSVLVDGSGPASKTGRPLGNKYFMQTGASCVDSNTGKMVPRYIYVDNVPDPNIKVPPGLVAGVIEDLDVFNPFKVMSAFAEGGSPKCKQITLYTIDASNNVSQDTQYVTLTDITEIPRYDIISEGFDNMNSSQTNTNGDDKTTSASSTSNQIDEKITEDLSEDMGIRIYYMSLAFLVIYVLYKAMKKSM